MDAYTLSDAQTRRKLDEMLKTWKEPVPGAMDTRPVFPPEVTRNIENALIKARTAFLTNQQTHSRSQQDIMRGRANGTPTGFNTPTPPGIRPTQPYTANGQESGTSVRHDLRVVSAGHTDSYH